MKTITTGEGERKTLFATLKTAAGPSSEFRPNTPGIAQRYDIGHELAQKYQEMTKEFGTCEVKKLRLALSSSVFAKAVLVHERADSEKTGLWFGSDLSQLSVVGEVTLAQVGDATHVGEMDLGYVRYRMHYDTEGIDGSMVLYVLYASQVDTQPISVIEVDATILSGWEPVPVGSGKLKALDSSDVFAGAGAVKSPAKKAASSKPNAHKKEKKKAKASGKTKEKHSSKKTKDAKKEKKKKEKKAGKKTSAKAKSKPSKHKSGKSAGKSLSSLKKDVQEALASLKAGRPAEGKADW